MSLLEVDRTALYVMLQDSTDMSTLHLGHHLRRRCRGGYAWLREAEKPLPRITPPEVR